jgi:ABC-type phosphonate transport system ATPase subunit
MARPVRQLARDEHLGLVATLTDDPPRATFEEPAGGLDRVVQARLADRIGERSAVAHLLVGPRKLAIT